jgi:hypothetical protein
MSPSSSPNRASTSKSSGVSRSLWTAAVLALVLPGGEREPKNLAPAKGAALPARHEPHDDAVAVASKGAVASTAVVTPASFREEVLAPSTARHMQILLDFRAYLSEVGQLSVVERQKFSMRSVAITPGSPAKGSADELIARYLPVGVDATKSSAAQLLIADWKMKIERSGVSFEEVLRAALGLIKDDATTDSAAEIEGLFRNPIQDKLARSHLVGGIALLIDDPATRIQGIQFARQILSSNQRSNGYAWNSKMGTGAMLVALVVAGLNGADLLEDTVQVLKTPPFATAVDMELWTQILKRFDEQRLPTEKQRILQALLPWLSEQSSRPLFVAALRALAPIELGGLEGALLAYLQSDQKSNDAIEIAKLFASDPKLLPALIDWLETTGTGAYNQEFLKVIVEGGQLTNSQIVRLLQREVLTEELSSNPFFQLHVVSTFGNDQEFFSKLDGVIADAAMAAETRLIALQLGAHANVSAEWVLKYTASSYPADIRLAAFTALFKEGVADEERPRVRALATDALKDPALHELLTKELDGF